MLLSFFIHLRTYRVPISIRELIDLLAAMQRRLVFADVRQFYFLSRLCLVKDEKYYDRFDQAFDAFFNGLDQWQGVFEDTKDTGVLREILSTLFPKKSELEIRALVNEYQESLDSARKEKQEAAERDAGGDTDKNGEGEGEGEGEGDGEGEGEGESGEQGEGEDGEEGEGTGGKKGIGSSEIGEAGIRDEGEAPAQLSASKVWQQRLFEDYDPEVELGTRNIKMALRRLRKFARSAAEMELDLADTIRSTARNGGILDIREVPERHNAVKVLLFLDIGGSMDEHIQLCAQLFSAARSEFKYLDYFYFHNFIYESLWHENDRRNEVRLPTWDVLRRFGSDYKIIFVGDASMARHEIAEKGGSVEHYNSEPGEVWLARIRERFRKVVWLNPVDPASWQDVYSIQMIRRLMDDEMYPLSVEGIEQAMRSLVR